MFTSQQISSYNELELSLYHYITQNMETVAYMRIRELADETHVSTATILRFCRKNQCEGFSEFKVKLKILLSQKGKLTKQELKSPHQAVYEFFERSQSPELEEKIRKAAKLIADASNVIFIGIGSSGIMGEYGARFFSNLGVCSMYIKDPHYPIHTRIQKDSVTIALSTRGENPYVLPYLQRIKQEKHKIIAITNNRQSTMAKISDISIPYYVKEVYHEITDLTTHTPVIFLLEWLGQEVYNLISDIE
ncbi:MurR/RpiR family transcriptional regulator [Paenibacillus sp. FSL R5-0766]|uniref:MurR/RpiR family transcriptional regulator n=1 Tax=Paenibacillus TaxID=44249 RepID=UPI00096CE98B|nr:MurR/RpiR family transcriptional regulator [Paenibacillus sp. FSL R5-0765]MCF7754184.1 MurR/RpiR family transcriptional regulator [Paenibacillus xylanexedens]OMF65208.1 RpiR family transcriptional regulator [Paenibacillus sp. FSL R5-0765]